MSAQARGGSFNRQPVLGSNMLRLSDRGPHSRRDVDRAPRRRYVLPGFHQADGFSGHGRAIITTHKSPHLSAHNGELARPTPPGTPPPQPPAGPASTAR